MPRGTVRPCSSPRCAAYALPGTSYCVEHQSARFEYMHATAQIYERGAGAARTSYHNRRFRALRDAFMRAHPICACCKLDAATDLDHIERHKGDPRLFWDQSNWQALCASCHRRKTAREMFIDSRRRSG